jgi:hypothetical protein
MYVGERQLNVAALPRSKFEHKKARIGGLIIQLKSFATTGVISE